MTDYIAQAGAVRSQMEQQGNAIARDEDLTVAARSQRLDTIWSEGTATLEALHQQHQQEQTASRDRSQKAVFAPPSSDPARMSSLRDAMDRAKAAAQGDDATDALLSLLNTAEMTGDEDQAYAVFVAAERGMHLEVVEQYIQDRPDAAQKYAEYREQHRQNLTRTITEGMAFSAPARPMIGGSNTWFG